MIHAPKRLSLLVCSAFFLLSYCRNIEEATIENLREKSTLTDYLMTSLEGRRDGDRLPVRLVFEAPSSNLRMDLLFRIGVPTRLESGQYHWERQDEVLEGRVRASSVTFLGGQSDNLSLYRRLFSVQQPLTAIQHHHSLRVDHHLRNRSLRGLQ